MPKPRATLIAAADQAAIAAVHADIHTPLLDEYLRQLYLGSFISNHAKFALEAANANQGYADFLLALAECEVAQRQQRRHTLRIREAHLPTAKELADFDFSVIPSLNKTSLLELARGNYLANAENLLLIGRPGLGKTHVATALALAACRQGRRVRFYNAASLVNELLLAQEQHQVERLIAAAGRHQLIVLDELGFIPFTNQGAQLMFQFCAALHEHVSLIITTNLKFADWVQVFGNDTLTAALLDRLTHRAHILEFLGTESFRFKHRLKRQTQLPELPQGGDVPADLLPNI